MWASALRFLSANYETFQRAYQRATRGMEIMSREVKPHASAHHRISQPVAVKKISCGEPLILR
jgi:hypothetical protein